MAAPSFYTFSVTMTMILGVYWQGVQCPSDVTLHIVFHVWLYADKIFQNKNEVRK